MAKHKRRRRLRGKVDGRNASLFNFINPPDCNSEKKNNQSPSIDSATEQIICPKCGKPDSVIKRGVRIAKLRGNVQRYECKTCNHRFVHTPYIRMRWPDWVHDAVLEAKVNGLRDSQIAKTISNEARRRNENVRISSKSIHNIVRRAVKILLEFERYAPRSERAAIWQIDDTPQPYSKKKDQSQRTVDKNTNSRVDNFLWITNIFEEDSRYWLSAVVSDNRNYLNSEMATRLALQRAKYGPQLIKCDGYKGHVKGARGALRHVEIIAITKKEDYGWINRIERLHQTMRSMAVKKHRHFRSIESLRITVEIVRINYNFIRPNEALLGSTPARKAGIDYPWYEGLTWTELIRFAFNFIRKLKRLF
jgi:transposase-like protein